MASLKLADSATFQPVPTDDFVTTFSAEIADAAGVNPALTYFETDVFDAIEIETEEEVEYTLVLDTDFAVIAMVLVISFASVMYFKFLKSKIENSAVKTVEAGRSEKGQQVNRFEKNCVENQDEKVYRLVIDDSEC